MEIVKTTVGIFGKRRMPKEPVGYLARVWERIVIRFFSEPIGRLVYYSGVWWFKVR